MTTEEATRALKACLGSGDDWPPSLPVFLSRAGVRQGPQTAAHRALPAAEEKARVEPPSVRCARLARIVDAEMREAYPDRDERIEAYIVRCKGLLRELETKMEMPR